ncbi:MAG: hypothetical protein IT368_03350 [Candidatus Hydrogenedentes bacterium]|nr:hypothetical protein [Candidatus Hydrogenedentota bacterium]
MLRQTLASLGTGTAITLGILLLALSPVIWPLALALGAAGVVAATALWPATRVLGLPRYSFYYLALVCAALIAVYVVEGYGLIWIFHWAGLDLTWRLTFADNAFRVTAFLVATATGALVYRKALGLPWVHAFVLLAVHWCMLSVAAGMAAAVGFGILYA